MKIMKQVEMEVNEIHATQAESAFKKDISTITSFCKKNHLKDVKVQHLSDGKDCFWGITGIKTPFQAIAPCAYELIVPLGIYSETYWYRSYIAQGRLLDYLLSVKRELQQQYHIQLDPIHHLYCSTILYQNEQKESNAISTELNSPQVQEFMQSHLAIYKRRFSTEIQNWKQYTSEDRIQSGDSLGDYFSYYNNAFAELLRTSYLSNFIINKSKELYL